MSEITQELRDNKEALLEIIKEITELAITCNGVDSHCFVNYSPHVSEFEVRLYSGKWRPEADPMVTGKFKTHGRKEDLRVAKSVVFQLNCIIKTGSYAPSKLEDSSKF